MTVCNIHVDIQRSLSVVLAKQYQRGYTYLTLGYFDTIDLNDHTSHSNLDRKHVFIKTNSTLERSSSLSQHNFPPEKQHQLKTCKNSPAGDGHLEERPLSDVLGVHGVESCSRYSDEAVTSSIMGLSLGWRGCSAQIIFAASQQWAAHSVDCSGLRF